MGTAPSVRAVIGKGIALDRVVDGKMVESRILMDGLAMMTQLGVIPAPKGDTAAKAGQGN